MLKEERERESAQWNGRSNGMEQWNGGGASVDGGGSDVWSTPSKYVVFSTSSEHRTSRTNEHTAMNDVCFRIPDRRQRINIEASAGY